MTDNLIEVKGVSKHYGGVAALDSCDLQVQQGAINGLIGPNGSGKTTLFNVVTGYERIQQGAVSFRGTDITNAPPDRVFKLGIGRTFQLTRLFTRLTVLENMLVATQRKEGWLRGIMRLAGSIGERRHAMELLDFVGITRLAHEPAANLSFGQRKLLERVADPGLAVIPAVARGALAVSALRARQADPAQPILGHRGNRRGAFSSSAPAREWRLMAALAGRGKGIYHVFQRTCPAQRSVDRAHADLPQSGPKPSLRHAEREFGRGSAAAGVRAIPNAALQRVGSGLG